MATLITLVDGVSSGAHLVVGLYALPPILASATTGTRPTALVAVYTFLLGLIGTMWNGEVGADYIVRLIAVGAAGGLAVWGASLREELSATARGAAVLSGLTERHNQLGEVETLEAIVDAAVPELGSMAVVNLLDEQKGEIGVAAVAGSSREVGDAAKRVRDSPAMDFGGSAPTAEVIRTGERRVYKHMGEAEHRRMAVDDEHLETLRALAPRSMLVVPLTDHDQTFGSLSLVSFDDDDRYGAGEIAFGEELARRAATAITSARLHEQQVHLADTLQASLLPRALPEIDGLEIAAGFRPANRLAGTIGGDFYDVLQHGEATWKAVMGDVCGKGPEAAALTSLARDTLRAAALRGDTPKQSLQLLNDAILEANADGRFCTCAVVRFDMSSPTTELTMCNAGHPPPLIMRKDGKVEPLGPGGTLLGIYEDPALADTSGHLREGDLLFMYTDGVFEARPGRAAGEVNVQALLAECKGMSAPDAAAQIEERVFEMHGGEPDDDVAILVMRRA